MRYLIFTAAVLFFFGCKESKKSESPKKVENESLYDAPAWLLGSWKRVGEKEGNQTYEYWRQNEEDNFVGMGCTLKGTDTIWREDILLARNANGATFEVVGLGDTVATVFKITEMTKNKFVCENEQNEFPKKIEYAFDGKNINAEISGGGPTIPFHFIRMKQ